LDQGPAQQQLSVAQIIGHTQIFSLLGRVSF
jgi:hypothetical protein